MLRYRREIPVTLRRRGLSQNRCRLGWNDNGRRRMTHRNGAARRLFRGCLRHGALAGAQI
jgi:hypothetical protein